MKTIAKQTLNRADCLKELTDFWQAETRIEQTFNGLAVALPMLYPDGWQVVIELEQLTPNVVKLTDKGRTLGKLIEDGLNWDRNGSRNQSLLDERLNVFELQRDGFEIFTTTPLPLQGLKVHFFAEALVSVAHLVYRIEAGQMPQSVADAAVRRLLEARKVRFGRGETINGAVESQIHIDYLIRQRSGMAIEVVKRHRDILPYMEQWGWRWNDIKKANPDMIRAMIFDPDQQEWNETALKIGRAVCNVFCPYYESESLEAALKSVA